MQETPRWKLIIFHKGKRVVKLVSDPRKAQAKVKELAERDIKAHVVCRRFPKFPPKGQPEHPDQLWCPYCRRWRYFAVPKHPGVHRDLGIACCKWCLVSENDGYVKGYNGTWNGRVKRSRGKSKKLRRHRVLQREADLRLDRPMWRGCGGLDQMIREIQRDNIKALKRELKEVREGRKVKV